MRFGLSLKVQNRSIPLNEDSPSTPLNILRNDYKALIEELLHFFYTEKNITENEKIINSSSKISWLETAFAHIGIEPDIKIFDLSNKEFSKMPRLKHTFLKENFKEDWYAIKDKLIKKHGRGIKTKNYEILNSLPFLQKVLKDFFEESEQLYKELDEIVSSPDNELKRKSDLRFVLQKINWDNTFKKIIKLFSLWFVDHKNDVEIVEKIKKSLMEFDGTVNHYISFLGKNESFGVSIDHLSLNYYTINKTAKEYDKEIEEKLTSLNKPYEWNLWELYWIDKNQPIEQLRNDMKMFKAKQKSAFLQQLQNWVSFEEFQKLDFTDNKWELHKDYELLLFKNIINDTYNKMLEITSKITKEKDKDKRKELKEKRWKYFIYHKEYKNFCDEFKKVASQYWRLKAEKLSLEREKEQARLERWLAILSKDSDWNYYINSFSNNDSKNAFKKLKNINSESGDYSYLIMSSITMRALQKLCWKENFRKTIIDKIDQKFIKIVKYDGYDVKKIKSFDEIGDDILEFYVNVLMAQSTIDISYRWWKTKSLNLLKSASNLSEFEILLKQETYTLKECSIPKKDFEKILNTYNGNQYQITSKDLEKNRSKSIFTKWWNIFWSPENKDNNYTSRINPELTISLRKWNELFKKEQPHRKASDNFLLTMSYSHYTDKSYIDDAFIKDEERKSSLEQFNKNYNEDHKFDYIYWLDKWTKELVTLWVFKKVWDKLEKVNISEEIPVYRITEKWLKYSRKYLTRAEWYNWEREIFLYKNPSLFIDEIDNEELFEKVHIDSCIWNLNCAKLIKWNIILNWDINWFLSLNKIAAKRKLYLAITEWKIRWDTVVFGYENGNKYIWYKYENRWEIYKNPVFFLESFTDIISEREFEIEFNEYIKLVKNHNSKEDVSISWINKKRSSISWNIVWIMMKLQESFPWYIAWEAITIKSNEEDLRKNHSFLWNMVNDKIYQKLMLSLDVPPILKKYRSEIKDKEYLQHGKVFYVNKESTSSACPSCNDTLTITNNWWQFIDKTEKNISKLFWHLTEYENEMHHLTDEEYDNLYDNDESFKVEHTKKWKKKSNIYLAWENCDYNMKHNPKWFDFIQSWDDLATYNIAKKAKEYLEFLAQWEN